MLQRVRRFAIRLHRDESGPNTVEWVLLIVVALLVLISIYFLANWAIDKMGESKKKLEKENIHELK